MAIDKFIPEVWSARLTRRVEPRLVLAQFANHDYEGEIREKGDTVHIRNFTKGGQIRDYQRNTSLGAPDRPSDDETTLVIDQAKAFYIAVDDVDEVQSDLTIMDKFLDRTARNLAEVMDRHAASRYLGGVASDNRIGAVDDPVTLGLSSADYTPYQLCVEARRILRANSVPLENLWMVVNSDVEALFLNDPQFIQGGAGIGDANVVRTGSIGRIAGFEIFVTEAVASAPMDLNDDGDTSDPGEGGTVITSGGQPVADGLAIVFGAGNYALTWANQIVKVEAERLQGQFGDAVKGLNVFGTKILETESFGVAYIDPDLPS